MFCAGFLIRYLTIFLNPKNICQHGFYPFLAYKKQSIKYSKLNSKKSTKENWKKKKVREIRYAAHIDSWIYRYYSFLLNNQYNQYMKNQQLDEVAIAYRTNKSGKSNIDYSAKAFEFIKEQSECYVIIGDFKDFFSNIDHQYLKKMMERVLQCTRLPDDYYKIFKSQIVYSYVLLEDIKRIKVLHGENSKETRNTILKKKQFRQLVRGEYKKYGIYLHKNVEYQDEAYGIPQGSPLSGILANIYMIEFDCQIKQLVLAYKGKYYRYSDDFIIILSGISENVMRKVADTLHNLFNENSNVTGRQLVILQKIKTKIFQKEEKNIFLLNTESFEKEKQHAFIKFLGFSYDGSKIFIANSTIGRFYGKMYRKIRTIKRQKGYVKSRKNGNLVKVSCTNLYQQYSIKGANAKNGRGNFITYTKRAETGFPSENSVSRSIRNHMIKIRKRLDKIIPLNKK